MIVWSYFKSDRVLGWVNQVREQFEKFKNKIPRSYKLGFGSLLMLPLPSSFGFDVPVKCVFLASTRPLPIEHESGLARGSIKKWNVIHIYWPKQRNVSSWVWEAQPEVSRNYYVKLGAAPWTLPFIYQCRQHLWLIVHPGTWMNPLEGPVRAKLGAEERRGREWLAVER